MFKTLTTIIENTDFQLLHEQKLALVKVSHTVRGFAREEESLEGIINFLDAVGDAAEEDGLWVNPISKS